jgi:hypothetical protein
MTEKVSLLILISLQHKKIRDTYENPKLTPEQKRELLDTTYLQMIKIAQRGNDIFRRTEKRGYWRGGAVAA